MKKITIILSLIFFSTISLAHVGHYKKFNKIEMEILKDGDVIGYNYYFFKKHKDEKFLFPCSDIRKEDIPLFLEENGYSYKEAVLYRTVASDLADLADVKELKKAFNEQSPKIYPHLKKFIRSTNLKIGIVSNAHKHHILKILKKNMKMLK